jgi:hypothetical protein
VLLTAWPELSLDHLLDGKFRGAFVLTARRLAWAFFSSLSTARLAVFAILLKGHYLYFGRNRESL